MKLFELRQINSALASLSESTNLVVDYHWGNGPLRVELKGLNSPYASHTDVEFSSTPAGEEPPQWTARFTNSRCRLLVNFSIGVTQDAEAGLKPQSHEVVVAGEIPASKLNYLFARVREFVSFETNSLLIWVATTAPLLVEFDEDGKPVFAEPKRPSLHLDCGHDISSEGYSEEIVPGTNSVVCPDCDDELRLVVSKSQ